ncbi:hypothetical protein A6A05_10345 [Magnetospirillum moscoviense]|uniref:Dystroglycan-type cadherin-like domain-containing protein n=2 Tax=Magnetospirillum moscoviense TaxID=1437059 RepID=A0A178MV79_9PROT|nr:hypothetical protein A6A05_10345 [Magnetospirillum moscoviense]
MMALEPRIMFDGAAMAEAIDAHSDGADAVMPVAVTTNPRVLLLSSRVADGGDLALAAKDDVLVVRYDAEADSPDAILSRLSHALDGQQASSIALASHGANGAFELTAQYGVSLAGIAGDGALQAFMTALGAQITEGGRIDLLACGVAGDSAGNALLAYLSDITGRSVAASTDSTGNAAFGGDWHLEAGDVDASQYFHAAALAGVDGLLANPEMVADINPGVNSSSVGMPVNVNGTLYFRANDGTNGIELWKYDRINAPSMVADIRAGANSSGPNNLANVNGTLYFGANDGTNGTELWKYDGTNAPSMVANINPGANSSVPEYMTNVNGTLYFGATDGTNGQELWKYDGINAPSRVADINPGANSSTPEYLTNVNGTLYFRADDGTNGRELWKYDGTNAPSRVADIRAGANSSSPGNMINVNGTLYFGANDGTNGTELWKYDGINAPSMVADINPGATGSSPSYLTNVNGTLYFSASDGTNGNELWKYDGTNTPSMVANIGPAGSPGNIEFITNANGTLYFSAGEGTNDLELWKYDGINAPSRVADIWPGATGSSPTNMIYVNGTLYFSASEGSNGRELWRYIPPSTASSSSSSSSPPPPPRTGEAVSVKIQAPIAQTGDTGASLVTAVRAPAGEFAQGVQGNFQAMRHLSTTGGNGFQVAVGTPSVNAVRDGALFVQKGIPAVLPESRMVNFSIPIDAFGHTSAEANITLAAKLTDGRPLPAWLSFDSAKGVFVGEAPEGFNGALSVVVVARDNAGNEVGTTFEIRVRGGGSVIQNNAPPASENQPPQGEVPQAPGQQGELAPDPAAPVIKLSDFGPSQTFGGQTFAGKPSFQEELRMANRLSGARQAQLLAAARAVARTA